MEIILEYFKNYVSKTAKIHPEIGDEITDLLTKAESFAIHGDDPTTDVLDTLTKAAGVVAFHRSEILKEMDEAKSRAIPFGSRKKSDGSEMVVHIGTNLDTIVDPQINAYMNTVSDIVREYKAGGLTMSEVFHELHSSTPVDFETGLRKLIVSLDRSYAAKKDVIRVDLNMKAERNIFKIVVTHE